MAGASGCRQVGTPKTHQVPVVELDISNVKGSTLKSRIFGAGNFRGTKLVAYAEVKRFELGFKMISSYNTLRQKMD